MTFGLVLDSPPADQPDQIARIGAVAGLDTVIDGGVLLLVICDSGVIAAQQMRAAIRAVEAAGGRVGRVREYPTAERGSPRHRFAAAFTALLVSRSDPWSAPPPRPQASR
jgi:hypothetical protein